MEQHYHNARAQEASSASDAQNLDTASKEKHQRRFQRGLRWLGVGVALMGLSFCLNFLLFSANTDCTTAMFIMTSLGAVGIVKGMADIFGL